MEIVLERKQTACFRESVYQTKRVQESVESVVPDTDEDIEKIAAVQTSVFLKSKDLSSRGVIVSGEARASVLYISEGRQSLNRVQLTRDFSVEFELPEFGSEVVTQAFLSVQAADARAVNPRKLSVSFDLQAELSCYEPQSVSTEAALPENAGKGLHLRTEETELLLCNAACEKSFAVGEQFPIPAGKRIPLKLLTEQTELRVSECQLVGSKAILKGSASVRLAWLGEEKGEPEQAEFSAPFSQILDIGAENMDLCSVRPQLTGAFFDLAEAISGEKTVDTELHILLQLVSWKRQKIRYVADAYSNLAPLAIRSERMLFDSAGEKKTLRVTTEESVTVMEDCERIAAVFPTLSRCAWEKERLGASAALDILYRTESGELAAVRRTLILSDENAGEPLRLTGVWLDEEKLEPEGKSLRVRLSMEAEALSSVQTEINAIEALTLDRDNAYDQSAFPSLTLVRVQGESLWELAKRHHSSVEAIEALADQLPEKQNAMILIPRSIS